MTTQIPSPSRDEEIDLRRWIGTLIRGKWVILALTVVAIAASSIVNYLLLTPVYVTSGTTALPTSSGVKGVGMTPLGYQGFASSNSVMDPLQKQLGLELEETQLLSKYEFELDGSDSLLNATASADTGEKAYLLMDSWLKTYNKEVSVNIQNKFKSSISSSAVEVETLRAQLTEAQSDLDTLNLNNLIGGLEAQRSALEADLINSEEKLRLLIKSSIANDDQRLTLLQIILDTHNQPSAGPATNISLVDESSVSEEAVLERARSLTEVRLSTMQRELASSEVRLRQLTWSQIPVTEASILALESVLDTVPLYLKEPSDGSTIPNTVYLHFDQALSEARVTLASDVIELERARSLTEVRLSTMQSELASSEGRLRQLTWSQIPVTEASILALESVLGTVPLYLKETPDGSTIPNPVYLHFDRALSEARVTLASDVIEKDRLTLRISDSETELLALGKHLDTINTELAQIEKALWTLRISDSETQLLALGKHLDTINTELDQIEIELESKFNTGYDPAKKELEALDANAAHLEQFLQASIPSLKEELKQVGGRIDAARNERFILDNALVQINEELQRANTRLGLLKAIEPDLVSFSTPTTAIRPQIPSSPTAPQRVRNILLFTILGSFLGFLIVIVAELNRGRPVTSIPLTE